MTANPVLILGAGATRACGGPLTNEILPPAFMPPVVRTSAFLLPKLKRYLKDEFRVAFPESGTKDAKPPPDDDYPPLPLLLSLLDTSIDRRESLSEKWTHQDLVQVRRAVEYSIFGVVNEKVGDKRSADGEQLHQALLEKVFGKQAPPNIISLNYDILVDNAMIRPRANTVTFPDYGCDIRMPEGRDRFGRLLKLHGSLNWLYCSACQRLELLVNQARTKTEPTPAKMYDAFRSLGERVRCADCRSLLDPVLITPTHLKDYRNPHITSVWHQAHKMLRSVDRVVFVGYSLPENDVEVIYLLKRGLRGVKPKNITVIEMDQQGRKLTDHPVGRRYRAIFGEGIDWHVGGLEKWLDAGKSKRKRRLSPEAKKRTRVRSRPKAVANPRKTVSD